MYILVHSCPPYSGKVAKVDKNRVAKNGQEWTRKALVPPLYGACTIGAGAGWRSYRAKGRGGSEGAGDRGALTESFDRNFRQNLAKFMGVFSYNNMVFS